MTVGERFVPPPPPEAGQVAQDEAAGDRLDRCESFSQHLASVFEKSERPSAAHFAVSDHLNVLVY